MSSQPVFYFHVRQDAREKYEIEETLFATRGDVVFVNFQQSRLLAAKINQKRQIKDTDPQFLNPAMLNAMGLLHEIYHFIISAYREDKNGQAFDELISMLEYRLEKPVVDTTLETFTNHFPAPEVYSKKKTSSQFLNESTDGTPNRNWSVEELILVWLTNTNPAYNRIKDLIDDNELKTSTEYVQLVELAKVYFDDQPTYGPLNQSLLDMLMEPARRSPDDLMGQLEYIKNHWGTILSRSPFWKRLLMSMDFIREEGKWFLFKQGGWNVSKDVNVEAPVFHGELFEQEPEAFSPDLDWMPRVVMIAKSTFVWLDQISKQFKHPIHRLDEIPDEELDRLASKGITALWLIGLWNRSRASAVVKQMKGNPEAVASAYSLYNYEINHELGGYEAYENLRNRCSARGIRLASDMVPNHMAIDSEWVINHPDWFLSLPYPPYPNYAYNGHDLSNDPRVGLYIEDGYWHQTDAAVTFKRVDRWTGDTRYIYHGNDGTSMPWNDTAQLNYLLPYVREAVIQTILHVARLFPIIRFDAAMTLAKRHYQRLWFPLPGSGGDIPSRAEHAMTKEEFDRAFPVEFWREVVDRVAVEVPNTLLLAEAFWMMEGYFVRSLGMHRVYNSAFMHMFKKEENSKYRYLIKNTLEFNPQILKRYVNFMNNPDEETAVNQFGKGDKYFGVVTMMATLPGLPMFGHGQFEGFAEKYGMEYKKAYWNEEPDQYLIERHYREIVPLLKKRYIFSDVDHFLLYDFYQEDGHVNEDVFSFSNRFGHEKALVIFHNKFNEVKGWIRTSVAFLDHHGNMTQRVLGQGLDLPHGNSDEYTIFKDHMSGLEYIRSTRDMWERGLFLELNAFKYQVLWEFRQVVHTEQTPYAQLAQQLGLRGVPSIEDALIEMKLKPVHASFYYAINYGSVEYLHRPVHHPEEATLCEDAFVEKVQHVLDGVEFLYGKGRMSHPTESTIRQLYHRILQLGGLASFTSNKNFISRVAQTFEGKNQLHAWHTLFAWSITHLLSSIDPDRDLGTQADSAAQAWYLDRVVKNSAVEFDRDEDQAHESASIVKILSVFSHQSSSTEHTIKSAMVKMLIYDGCRDFLKVNLHQDIWWYNKEQMDKLIFWLSVAALVIVTVKSPSKSITPATVKLVADFHNDMNERVSKSQFRYQVFVESCQDLLTDKPKKPSSVRSKTDKKVTEKKGGAKKKKS